MSCFSPSGDLFVDHFAFTFSTAKTSFTVLDQRVLVGCEPNSECFSLATEILVRQVVKADLDGGTDLNLRREDTETAEVVARLVPKVAAADQL